eukprot:TRINITY_DN10051_c0_g2_i4.p1 TRINITY_DN10051_c0_g2~~TRINITY_DN10051_c0_g2_i4.p1  ORF type:complete len:841 (+),score=234.21 TRINITY_DN10051_c0_g2_i4:46-2568(+)
MSDPSPPRSSVRNMREMFQRSDDNATNNRGPVFPQRTSPTGFNSGSAIGKMSSTPPRSSATKATREPSAIAAPPPGRIHKRTQSGGNLKIMTEEASNDRSSTPPLEGRTLPVPPPKPPSLSLKTSDVKRYMAEMAAAEHHGSLPEGTRIPPKKPPKPQLRSTQSSYEIFGRTSPDSSFVSTDPVVQTNPRNEGRPLPNPRNEGRALPIPSRSTSDLLPKASQTPPPPPAKPKDLTPPSSQIRPPSQTLPTSSVPPKDLTPPTPHVRSPSQTLPTSAPSPSIEVSSPKTNRVVRPPRPVGSQFAPTIPGKPALVSPRMSETIKLDPPNGKVVPRTPSPSLSSSEMESERGTDLPGPPLKPSRSHSPNRMPRRPSADPSLNSNLMEYPPELHRTMRFISPQKSRAKRSHSPGPVRTTDPVEVAQRSLSPPPMLRREVDTMSPPSSHISVSQSEKNLKKKQSHKELIKSFRAGFQSIVSPGNARKSNNIYEDRLAAHLRQFEADQSVGLFTRIASEVDRLDTWTSKTIIPLDWTEIEDFSEDQFGMLVIEPCKKIGFHFEFGKSEILGRDPDSINPPYAIEHSQNDVAFYAEHFAMHEHVNYGTMDEEGFGHIFVSVETVDAGDDAKIILRTKNGFDRLYLPSSTVGSASEIVKTLKIQCHKELGNVNFKLNRVKTDMSQRLREIEKKNIIRQYKFGLLYVTQGQTQENEMFSNVETSPEYEEFLEFLGDKIKLEGWSHYRGGLNVQNNATGTHSVYTKHQNLEIMFHVSTLLPFQPDDLQRVERKRHLGNDIVCIIFNDGDQPFDPLCLTTHFTNVFIVISVDKSRTDDTYYKYVFNFQLEF